MLYTTMMMNDKGHFGYNCSMPLYEETFFPNKGCRRIEKTTGFRMQESTIRKNGYLIISLPVVSKPLSSIIL